MRALLARPAARVPLGALLVLALAAVGALAVAKQVRDGNDFPLYWRAARDLLAGRSPYDVGSGLHGYVYLPWFAWALVPLAALPLPAAAAGWYVAQLAFAWLGARALLAALRAAGTTPRAAVLAWATLPLAGLAHDNLVLGQANLLLLLLVALGARGALGAGRAAAGAALGAAAALKMPAAFLALPLARRGRMRPLAGFALAAGLALLLPLLPAGPAGGVRLLREWHAKVVAPAAAGTLQGSRNIDQSPHAALRRLLVAGPAFGTRAVNVATLSPPAFARVSRAVAIALVAGYLLVWLAAPAPGRPLALLLDLALACCAMVQVSGFHLKAQFVVLLLPAWLAATLAWSAPGPAARGTLLVAGALFLLSQPGLVGRAASDWLLAYSSMTLGTLLLAGTLAAQRVGVRPRPAVPDGAPASGTPA